MQEVSIIPRGMAAGYTLTRPENDDSHITRNKLIDMVTMMLGGRAAEEIVIKDISTGASNDIERASNIAKKMVTQWGMSKAIGNMYLGGDKEVFLGRDYGTTHSYSEDLGGIIDNEIKAILDSCYTKALEILQANRKVMDNMVKVLFEKETIYTEEVNMLFDGKTADEVIAYIDERQAKKETYKKSEEPKIIIVEEKPTETVAQQSEEVSVEVGDTAEEKSDEVKVEETPTIETPQEKTQEAQPKEDENKKSQE